MVYNTMMEKLQIFSPSILKEIVKAVAFTSLGKIS
jgi:hypothetical protein